MATTTREQLATEPPASRIGRSAALVMAFTGVQTFLQFAIQVVLAASFGTRSTLDAYFASLTVPMLIGSIFLGVVYVTLVPMITERRVSIGDADADDLGVQFARATFLVLTGLALVIGVFSRVVAKLLVPGFDAASLQLTGDLLRVTVGSSVFSATSIVLGCIYYSRQRFWPPMLFPIANGVVTLAVIFLYQNEIGIRAAAWGMFAGSIVGLCMLIPRLHGLDARLLSFRFDHPGLNAVVRLMAPLLAASILVRTTMVTDRIFASYLGEGAISLVNFANRIVAVVAALGVQGISVAIFPVLARATARKDTEELSRLVHLNLRWSLIIAGVVVAMTLVLRGEIARLLLEHGKVRHSDAATVSGLIVWYSGMLVAHIVGNGIVYTLYSLKTSRLVAMISGIGAVLYIPAVAGLMGLLGARGIAAAASLLAIFNAGWFVFFLNRRWVSLQWANISKWAVRVGLSAGFAALVAIFVRRCWGGCEAGVPQLAGCLAVTSAACLLTYWACLTAMGMEEAKWAWKQIGSILHRR